MDYFFTWGGFNLNVSHSIRGSYGLFFLHGEGSILMYHTV